MSKFILFPRSFPLKAIVFAASTLGFVEPSHAQDPCDSTRKQDAPLCVTVIANRTAQPLDKIGSSVTILTKEDLKRRGDRTVADALKRLTGFHISRTGGIGGATQLRVRGLEPGQVQVLIDGVPVADATGTSRQFDFSTILVRDIARIEVLRGAQSALYGSDAIAGVINIITRDANAPKGVSGFLEGGSYNTKAVGLRYDGGFERFKYGASVTAFQTDGFSRITAGAEKDGSEILEGKGYLSSEVNDVFSFDVRGGVQQSETEFDPGATTDGIASEDKLFSYGSLETKFKLFDEKVLNTNRFSLSQYERKFDQPTGFYRFSSFDSRFVQAGSQWDVFLRKRDVATLGFEWQEERAKISNERLGAVTIDIDDAATTASVFGQYIWGVTDAWTVTFGGRHENHSSFGHANTYRVTTAYTLSFGTILRGSVATGFKAPSLYQLYAPTFGNASLKPEESLSLEAGFEQAFWDGKAVFVSTVFQNRLKNMIGFSGGYQNINRAKTSGIETELQVFPIETVGLTLAHSFLETEDLRTGRRLPRTPKHTFAAGIDWNVTDKFSVGVQQRYVSKVWDSLFSALTAKAYFVTDLNLSYDVTKDVELYARVENLFDSDYSETERYRAAGFSVYGGVRFALQKE